MKKTLSIPYIYHELVDRLLSRLDYIRLAPKNILIIDLFCDHAKKFLQGKFPDAKIDSAENEAAVEKYKNNLFDLIIAPFSLLRDEGLLLCMTLGPDTFHELQKSFSTIDSHPHVYPFMDMHYLGDALKKLPLADPVVDREEITILYDDLHLFFQDLKNLQATFRDEKKSRGLFSKNKWEKMLLEYAKYKTENNFPVTLELIYGHGWKTTLSQQYDEEKNEVMISIDKIRR